MADVNWKKTSITVTQAIRARVRGTMQSWTDYIVYISAR